MKITFDLNSFKTEFLNPILEVNKEGKAAIFVEEDKIYCLTAINNNSIVLYNSYKPFRMEDAVTRFNVNLGKLAKAILCAKPQSNLVTITVNQTRENNNLSYEDESTKFNIRLIDDKLITLCSLNKKAIDNLVTDTEIIVTKDALVDIKKASDFASETSKFYIEDIGGKIYFFFGDKLSNSDNGINVLVANEYKGSITQNIYDVAFLDLIRTTKSDILFRLHNNGALIGTVQKDNSTLHYLTTQLKK